jgi:hypothetical protein
MGCIREDAQSRRHANALCGRDRSLKNARWGPSDWSTSDAVQYSHGDAGPTGRLLDQRLTTIGPVESGPGQLCDQRSEGGHVIGDDGEVVDAMAFA